MKFQDYMIDVTQKAADEVFRYAKAVPADKLDWKPLDAGRSVIDQCRELAMCPFWCQSIIEAMKFPEWDESASEAARKESEQWTTVEMCQDECNRRLRELSAFFKTLPDEKLSETAFLPFDGGRDFTVEGMMDYPKWNFNYHLGQIAYVQLLYGDKEMH